MEAAESVGLHKAPAAFDLLYCRNTGDYNLVLLDQLIKEEKLTWVGTCNELNAGYAADGYARARGVAACVATFTVGGLSIINAIAGSYSEDLPVICITGPFPASVSSRPPPH